MRPWYFSGRGLSDFESSFTAVAWIEISPIFVLNTKPVTSTISPISHFLRKPYSSSPKSSNFAKIWILPVLSCKSRKLTLPFPRFDMILPATQTVLFSYSSKLFFTVSLIVSLALVVITKGSLPASFNALSLS